VGAPERILELVRTHRAFGAAEPPPKMQAAKPHRSKPQKSPEKISARTI